MMERESIVFHISKNQGDFTTIPQLKYLSLGERECSQGSVCAAVNAFYRMARNLAILVVQLLLCDI